MNKSAVIVAIVFHKWWSIHINQIHCLLLGYVKLKNIILNSLYSQYQEPLWTKDIATVNISHLVYHLSCCGD